MSQTDGDFSKPESTSGTLFGDHFVPVLLCRTHDYMVHPAAAAMMLCPWCRQAERRAAFESYVRSIGRAI